MSHSNSSRTAIGAAVPILCYTSWTRTLCCAFKCFKVAFLRFVIFLDCARFAIIFHAPEKMHFWHDFAFAHLEHHFCQFISVNIINTKFSIKKVHLHVETILRRHQSSVYVQRFGRDARTKPFLQLIFIYIEILTYLTYVTTLEIVYWHYKPTWPIS